MSKIFTRTFRNAAHIHYAEEAAVQDFSAQGWSPTKLAEANLTIATRRLQIQYLAVWGETLNVSTHLLDVRDTCGSRYVGISRADGSAVAECIHDWGLVDRITGEARPLPDPLLSRLQV